MDNNESEQIASKLAGKKILLADDSPAAQRLLQHLLKPFNCPLDVAENGLAAVEKFQTGQFCLVFMDSVMPEMDGLTATREIRKFENETTGKTTPIIMLTANDSPEDIQNSVDAGCNAFLVKPVLKDKLLEAIKNCLFDITGNLTTEVSANPSTASTPLLDSGNAIIIEVDKEIEELIPGYLANRKKDCKILQEALLARDFETIRINGHSMKGTGIGYGFDKISEIGRNLERLAIDENLIEIPIWINELKNFLREVKITFV